MEIISTLTIKPMVEGIVNKLVIPKLEKLATRIGLEYDKLLIPRGEHFEEYFYRTYKKYSIINTLVFKNNQRQLKDIYVPLTLAKKNLHGNQEEYIKIEKYPLDFMSKYQKVLIIDTAGMGKSTLSKRMFLDIIDNGNGIPIYIELRRLSKGRSLLFEIQQQLNSLSKEFNSQLMLEFIQLGGFIFFFDGYDEVALNERDYVTRDLQDFISKANENIYILTSRPETALSSFGDFQQTKIEPLKKKEAYELLRKYDNQGETSRNLIEKLEGSEYEMVNDFLQNPLLVSLLFAAFDYKQTIPLKKHIFYRQVYDAHFDSHDLSKGDGYTHEKKSKLDIDDFDKVLRFIGFECLKQQKIEFTKDELLDIIGKAEKRCIGLTFKASDILDDLLKAVPLFCQDGTFYKWAHKSLQEYFAAQFIFKDVKENQNKILHAIYNSNNLEKYYNLLDLYYDIDISGFRKSILLPFLDEYISEVGGIDASQDIIIRKSLLFKRCQYLLITNSPCDFPKAFSIIKNEYKDFVEMGGMRRNIEEGYIFCLESSTDGNNKRLILLLLNNKKVRYIKIQQLKFNVNNIRTLLKDKPYRIDSNLENPLNKVCSWKGINSIIASTGGDADDLYINLEDCIKEKQKILEEINLKENPDDLLAGL